MKTNIISEDDLKVVYRLLSPDNALALKIARYTGLRINDVLRLGRWEIKGRFVITEQKTKKRRLVTINKKLLQEIQSYIKNNYTEGTYLFPSRFDHEKHRTRQAVWYDLKRIAKLMRFKINLAPHSMRKMYAVDLYERGFSMSDIADKLNHDNEATTILYALAHLINNKNNRKRKKPTK